MAITLFRANSRSDSSLAVDSRITDERDPVHHATNAPEKNRLTVWAVFQTMSHKIKCEHSLHFYDGRFQSLKPSPSNTSWVEERTKRHIFKFIHEIATIVRAVMHYNERIRNEKMSIFSNECDIDWRARWRCETRRKRICIRPPTALQVKPFRRRWHPKSIKFYDNAYCAWMAHTRRDSSKWVNFSFRFKCRNQAGEGAARERKS